MKLTCFQTWNFTKKYCMHHKTTCHHLMLFKRIENFENEKVTFFVVFWNSIFINQLPHNLSFSLWSFWKSIRSHIVIKKWKNHWLWFWSLHFVCQQHQLPQQQQNIWKRMKMHLIFKIQSKTIVKIRLCSCLMEIWGWNKLLIFSMISMTARMANIG